MADQELEELTGTETPRLTPLETLRHSTAHVMAGAVKRLFPEAKVTIGPAIEGGFYYDFDVARPFDDEDLALIEAEMKVIIDANHTFERAELSRDDARARFAAAGETYKVELLDAIAPDTVITTYRSGDFTDLCRGPHVGSTGEVKAFKLISVAGAYWRGDERNRMLQRIYGTAFFDRKALAEHLHRLEEAKRRDHRKLGQALDLFSINETIGGGLVLWHPKGARVRYLTEQYWREEHFANGYELVYSPHIARDDLWKTSGHLTFYRENMFAGMDVDGKEYLVKPMNCPFHVTIFKHGLRSYRELPLRMAELGTVYRYERSGVLHGLLRVRGFTQDDAHIFMRRDQLADELQRTLSFCLHILRTFGFTEFKLYLATRPEKFVGEISQWDEAEAALYEALRVSGIEYEVDAGGGAFYGPKIDLKLRDAIGREWQCSTIQVDFNLPERFDLTYVGDDGAKHRVVMLHRALLGSVERFFAVLVEHYAGAFPLWLAPLQARVITISEKQEEWAREVCAHLVALGLRVETDLSPDKLGAKIRRAQLEKIPYMLVVGDKEVAERTAAPRARDGKQTEARPLEELGRWLMEEARIPRGGVAREAAAGTTTA
ncbi:MAG: threonine--tRNA ligase [Myxococcales bacterium]|nr:threonine--tRNA ligase [Myxococcales bacterium]